MAESKVIVIDSSEESSSSCDSDQQPAKTEKEKDPMECPICLQTCIHPARLPCGHIFCFLCVKGVAYKNRRCAMCRREIPPEFLDHPQLVHGVAKTKSTEDGYQWYYEGRNGGWWEYDSRTSAEIENAFSRNSNMCDVLICGTLYTIDFIDMVQYQKENPIRKRYIRRTKCGALVEKKGVAGISGWWQYDERTSQDIEEAYKKGEKSCTILVAGYVYVVDFEAMLQQRQNDPSRRRHVKRDLASIPKKGVAGLRIEGSVDEPETESQSSTGNTYERQSSTNFISPITAADAAIRIATDIIGSTLAHADDSNRNDDREQSNGSRGQRELLDDAEELLDASQGTSIIGTSDHSDLFSQTLDDFRSLTLRNVIDSSDSEDDNEQIIL